jgi:hypothetical protein
MASRTRAARGHRLTRPTKTPTHHRRPDIVVRCSGSRIRTLEGISRRIYSPLHTSAADDRAQVPDRGSLGPSQRTQRRSVTRYDAGQRRVIFAGKRRSHGCQSQQPCPRRAADLRDSQPSALLRSGRVGRVWHPPGLPPGLPHASPGAELCDLRAGPVEGCPRAAAWSGSARPTGCHTATSVQDRR